MGRKILIIDDGAMILDTMNIIFRDMGYEVATFSDPRAGLEEAIRSPYDFIIVDIGMPGMNGTEVTAALRKARPDARALVYRDLSRLFCRKQRSAACAIHYGQGQGDRGRAEAVDGPFAYRISPARDSGQNLKIA